MTLTSRLRSSFVCRALCLPILCHSSFHLTIGCTTFSLLLLGSFYGGFLGFYASYTYSLTSEYPTGLLLGSGIALLSIGVTYWFLACFQWCFSVPPDLISESPCCCSCFGCRYCEEKMYNDPDSCCYKCGLLWHCTNIGLFLTQVILLITIVIIMLAYGLQFMIPNQFSINSAQGFDYNMLLMFMFTLSGLMVHLVFGILRFFQLDDGAIYGRTPSLERREELRVLIVEDSTDQKKSDSKSSGDSNSNALSSLTVQFLSEEEQKQKHEQISNDNKCLRGGFIPRHIRIISICTSIFLVILLSVLSLGITSTLYVTSINIFPSPANDFSPHDIAVPFYTSEPSTSSVKDYVLGMNRTSLGVWLPSQSAHPRIRLGMNELDWSLISNVSASSCVEWGGIGVSYDVDKRGKDDVEHVGIFVVCRKIVGVGNENKAGMVLLKSKYSFDSWGDFEVSDWIEMHPKGMNASMITLSEPKEGNRYVMNLFTASKESPFISMFRLELKPNLKFESLSYNGDYLAINDSNNKVGGIATFAESLYLVKENAKASATEFHEIAPVPSFPSLSKEIARTSEMHVIPPILGIDFSFDDASTRSVLIARKDTITTFLVNESPAISGVTTYESLWLVSPTNPVLSVPFAVLLTIFVCTLLYVAMCACSCVRKRLKQLAKADLLLEMEQFGMPVNEWFVDPDNLAIRQGPDGVLGKGGYGIVRKGELSLRLTRRTVVTKDVAIKKVLAKKEELGMVVREICLMTKLTHEHVALCYGCCITGDIVNIVMELCHQGQVLNWLFRKRIQGEDSVSLRLNAMLQLAQGMEYIHHGLETPLIHRDLKPENVLVSEDEKIKLVDFGLSKNVDSISQTVCGTLGYIPESYGDDPRKIDVYAFGFVCWEVFTLKRAYEADQHQQMESVFRSDDNRPSLDCLECEEMPHEIKGLIARCWDSNPMERPLFDEIVLTLIQACEDVE